MSNQVSIDDLFREKLSGGREQLNLGAWANMERMLEGKDPYTPEEEKKKRRRIFPLLGAFLLLTTAVVGGLFMRSHKKEKAIAMAQPTQTSPTKMSNTTNEIASTTATSTKEGNQNTASVDHQSEFNQPAKVSSTPIASNNFSTDPSTSNSDPAQTGNTDRARVDTKTNKQSTYSTSGKTTDPSTDHNPQVTSQNNSQPSDNKTTNAVNTISKEKDTPSSPTNTVQTRSAAAVAQANTPKPATASPSSVSSASSGDTPKENIESKEVTTIQREVRVEAGRQGPVFKGYDTTDESKSTTYASVEPLDYHKTNPRYVDVVLGEPAQKEAAAPKVEVAKHNVEPVVTTNNMSKASKGSNSRERSELREKLSILGQRLSTKKLILYPGMTAGVNAALFNTKHNYGGFHFGLSNSTRLSNTLSIMSELRFAYRSNAGFTVSDVQSSSSNYMLDTISAQSSNRYVHNYHIDSVVRKYNFKNMYSAEIPLTLNYHLKKLSLYAGINLVYNFGLNPTIVIDDKSEDRSDTTAKSFVFVPSEKKQYQYDIADFKGRFGMGYMFGASYSFSPRLYLDLRMTQTQWDRSRTVSSREISSGVFKVPYIQFSLGYRFKDFHPEK
jgi:hypothetical protein